MQRASRPIHLHPCLLIDRTMFISDSLSRVYILHFVHLQFHSTYLCSSVESGWGEKVLADAYWICWRRSPMLRVAVVRLVTSSKCTSTWRRVVTSSTQLVVRCELQQLKSCVTMVTHVRCRRAVGCAALRNGFNRTPTRCNNGGGPMKDREPRTTENRLTQRKCIVEFRDISFHPHRIPVIPVEVSNTES